MTTSIVNKKPILFGSDTHASVLSGDNVISGVAGASNATISVSGATNNSTTVGTTELVRDTEAISVTSALNTVSCFVITSIGTNGGSREVTFRIRLDDVNGTIIGTFAIINTVAALVKMQSVAVDIPNTTTDIVLTRQFTGTGESGTTIYGGVGDNLYVTVTESTDTHTADLTGSNTQNTSEASLIK